MSSHPPGEVSNRRKAAAIRLLSATVDDESAPIYLRVMSARSLLAQPKPESKPAEDEAEFPRGAKVVILADGQEYERIQGHGTVVILPANGRERLAEERQRQRLERLAETQIADDEPDFEPPSPAAEPVKVVSRGKALLREIRARRKAMREA
jgi:hypothetical protein